MRGILHSCAKIIVGLLDESCICVPNLIILASRSNFSLTKHKRLSIQLYHKRLSIQLHHSYM